MSSMSVDNEPLFVKSDRLGVQFNVCETLPPPPIRPNSSSSTIMIGEAVVSIAGKRNAMSE